MLPHQDYPIDQLPDANAVIKQALEFASPIEEKWEKQKKFGYVQTYSWWDRPNGGTPLYWVSRVSYHHDMTYPELYATLFEKHTEHEMEYIHMIDSYKLLETEGPWKSRQVHYKFPFPLTHRTFTIWLTQAETVPGRQFVNVTIPRTVTHDILKDTMHTQGAYMSVEVVTLLDDGRIRWVMATTSEAGGMVPQFLQRPQMSRAVADDVSQFREWLLEQRRLGKVPAKQQSPSMQTGAF